MARTEHEYCRNGEPFSARQPFVKLWQRERAPTLSAQRLISKPVNEALAISRDIQTAEWRSQRDMNRWSAQWRETILRNERALMQTKMRKMFLEAVNAKPPGIRSAVPAVSAYFILRQTAKDLLPPPAPPRQIENCERCGFTVWFTTGSDRWFCTFQFSARLHGRQVLTGCRGVSAVA